MSTPQANLQVFIVNIIIISAICYIGDTKNVCMYVPSLTWCLIFDQIQPGGAYKKKSV